MNVLTEEEWELVDRLGSEDTSTLRLRHHGNERMVAVIDQIECRQRTAKKLAGTLSRAPRLLFPSVLSAEQSTSDALAAYHASLIGCGQRVLDMTCGLGIDALHCSEKASEVVALDINPSIAFCAAHNAGLLKAENMTVRQTDSVQLLPTLPPDAFDIIFIDPARRDKNGKRLFALSDCRPDVKSLLPEMLKVAKRIIIKASPMLDVAHTLNELGNSVESIIALGDRNECKELVIICGRQVVETPILQAVTLNSAGETMASWSHYLTEEASAPMECGTPEVGHYLYEPYPSTMKIAPLKLLSSRLGLKKISANSHIYSSPSVIPNFPGRCYLIEAMYGFSKKDVKEIASRYGRINVSTRNFPLKPDELLKKLKLKQGGTHHLFATRNKCNQPLLIIS